MLAWDDLTNPCHTHLDDSFGTLNFQDLSLSFRPVVKSQVHDFVVPRELDIVQNDQGSIDLTMLGPGLGGCCWKSSYTRDSVVVEPWLDAVIS